MNVGKTVPSAPSPTFTIIIGGMVTIPRWFMTLFYPHENRNSQFRDDNSH